VGENLPEKWHRIDKPEDGLFTLIMLAGLETPDGVRQPPLYVCISDEGYLSEAFHFNDTRWQPCNGEDLG